MLSPAGLAISHQKEKPMPFDVLVIVALITGAFLTFAGALLYGQYQTQNIKRDELAAPTDEQDWRNAA